MHRQDRAHVQLCWLAFLLIRVAENTTDQTWHRLHQELDRLHLVTLATGSGTVAQRWMLTPGQRPSSPPWTCPSCLTASTSPPPAADPSRRSQLRAVTRRQRALHAFVQAKRRFRALVCLSTAELRLEERRRHLRTDAAYRAWARHRSDVTKLCKLQDAISAVLAASYADQH